jgi:hypothetical protein
MVWLAARPVTAFLRFNVRASIVFDDPPTCAPITASVSTSEKRAQLVAFSSKLNPRQLLVLVHVYAQASALVLVTVEVEVPDIAVPSRYEYPIGPETIGGVNNRWLGSYCVSRLSVGIPKLVTGLVPIFAKTEKSDLSGSLSVASN